MYFQGLPAVAQHQEAQHNSNSELSVSNNSKFIVRWYNSIKIRTLLKKYYFPFNKTGSVLGKNQISEYHQI